MRRRILLLLSIGALHAAPHPLAAQGLVLPPVLHDRLISINPLALIVFGYVSVEYEQTATRTTTWGLSLSNYQPDDGGYFSVDGKARYYPGGRALDGFSVGAVVGFTSLRDFGPAGDASGAAIGLGFNLEHQWLLGVDERFAATLGLGGKRLIFFNRVEGADRGLPFARLSIGWTF